MRLRNCTGPIAAGIIWLLCVCVDPLVVAAQEPGERPSAQRPPSCASYADCPKGMICAGAGGGATGSCMSPSQLPHPRPAYDPLPEGYLGSIYGRPIIQGQPPAGAPSSDAGGVWDLKEGVYRPPRGGRWTYRPGGADGFSGRWVYVP